MHGVDIPLPVVYVMDLTENRFPLPEAVEIPACTCDKLLHMLDAENAIPTRSPVNKKSGYLQTMFNDLTQDDLQRRGDMICRCDIPELTYAENTDVQCYSKIRER